MTLVVEATLLAALASLLGAAAGNVAVQAAAMSVYVLVAYRRATVRLWRRAAALRPTPPFRIVIGYTLLLLVVALICINTTDQRWFAVLCIVGIGLTNLGLLHSMAATRVWTQCQTANRIGAIRRAVAAPPSD